MRSSLLLLAVLFLALLIIIGCSGGKNIDPIRPGDHPVNALSGVIIHNSELNDIRLDGESIINVAYINLTRGRDTIPLEITGEDAGTISATIENGSFILPDNTRENTYEGPGIPLTIAPEIEVGLVELIITYHNTTDHVRRFWLAAGLEDHFPTPPFQEATVISPSGDRMDVGRDEMLVALLPSTPTGSFYQLLNALDMQIFERIVDSDVYRVGYAPGMDLFEAIKLVESSPIVDFAEPNYIRRASITPNDSGWNQKWDLQKMQGPAGWDIYTGDPTLIVGVIDSGIDRDHPDLSAKVVNGEDFISGGDGLGGETPGDGIDNNGDYVVDGNVGHGTHCSGIIGAMTNNSIGSAGVNWQTKLMGLRVFPADGDSGCESSALQQAWSYAKTTPNMVAVSMSLGGPYKSTTEQNALNSLWNAGVIICAAAGNGGSSYYEYPASYDHVVSVAATNSNDVKASFSTYNDKVDVSAPGVNIYSTYYNNTYAIASGTSMACPEVTGLMSLVRGYFPTYTAQEIVDQVTYTTDYIYDKNPSYVGKLGTGRINIYKALYQKLSPEYTIVGVHYDDDMTGLTDGNRDGFFNPGEVIGIGLSVRNDGIKDAVSPQGLLSIDDPYVHVIKGEISFPNIAKTERKDSNDEFLISIDNNCPDGYEVSYVIDFDDEGHTGPHEKPGTWKVFKDKRILDYVYLTGTDLPEGGRISKGIPNQAIMRVDIYCDLNYCTIDELTLYKFGSIDTGAVTGVRLYHDSDGDGVFDADGTDKQLATSGYYNPTYAGNFDNLNDPNSGNPNGPIDIPHPDGTFNSQSKITFYDIYLPATITKTNSFFIVVDLALKAVSGSTLQVGIINASDIKLRVPDTLDPSCLPVLSAEFVVSSTWETDRQITFGDSGHSWRPEGACDSKGNIFIVFDDDREGDFEIYLKKSTTVGDDFEDDKPITDESSNEFYPSIAVDKNDILHVVYYTNKHGNNNREIYYLRSSNAGENWDAPVRLTNANGDSRTPDIAVGPDNTLHVVWFDERSSGTGIYYKHSTDGGDNWSTDLKIADNTYYNDYPPPAIAVGGDGVIHVVWEYWDVQGYYLYGIDIRYSRSENNGASFSSYVNLTPSSGGFDYAVRIAADLDGNPYVVYHHDNGSSYDIHCRYSTNGGGSFLTKNLTSSAGATSARPDIFVNPDGFIDVVYKNNFGGTNNVYHTYSETGINGFNDPVQISFGGSVDTKDEWPRVIRGPERNIYAFWADKRTGNWEIFFNRYLY